MAALASGCLLSIDDGLVDAGAGADGAADDGPQADGPDGDAACTSGMVRVPATSDAGSFCVDSTEVTNGQYKAFLGAQEPPPSGSQIADCAWNTTYRPPGWTGTELDDHPVAYVDWCDAYGFCRWAGKRLCGAVGGGALDFNTGGGSLASEWFVACSRGGALTFPYGATYDPQACVGDAYDAGAQSTPVAVGSAPGCEGGYPGLFDMSGNVSEFLDSCSTSPDPTCGSGGPDCDLCLLVGGGYLNGGSNGSNLACRYANEVYRSSHYDDNGFRCCADAR